ncbi:hypothetical protein RRG08_001749 [Elysia crispata]|uniref:Uncharacterized protein n=1 Tax=Elysia crispata TaxID=231223 RepID=A0AAE1E029_9GAST|nr:hypothetical protein RRG08_001749 [Elysia crispata]
MTVVFVVLAVLAVSLLTVTEGSTITALEYKVQEIATIVLDLVKKPRFHSAYMASSPDLPQNFNIDAGNWWKGKALVGFVSPWKDIVNIQND